MFPCIEWPGQRNQDGYGVWAKKIAGRQQQVRAHRMVYEAVWGTIPPGLVLDHLCRNRACTNPGHLEQVTRGEDVRRGIVSEVQRGRHAARTHCKHGHKFTRENTRIVKDSRGVEYRDCVTCSRARKRRSYEKRKTNVGYVLPGGRGCCFPQVFM